MGPLAGCICKLILSFLLESAVLFSLLEGMGFFSPTVYIQNAQNLTGNSMAPKQCLVTPPLPTTYPPPPAPFSCSHCPVGFLSSVCFRRVLPFSTVEEDDYGFTGSAEEQAAAAKIQSKWRSRDPGVSMCLLFITPQAPSSFMHSFCGGFDPCLGRSTMLRAHYPKCPIRHALTDNMPGITCF